MLIDLFMSGRYRLRELISRRMLTEINSLTFCARARSSVP
jgi:hypothetical protein